MGAAGAGVAAAPEFAPAAGTVSVYGLLDGAGAISPAVSKMVDIKLKQGERVRLETPGGGGYGPATERSAEAQADDLRLGYITSGQA